MESMRFVSPTKEPVMENTQYPIKLMENPRFLSQSKEPMMEKIGSPVKGMENPRGPIQYSFEHTDPSHSTAAYYINMGSYTSAGACADDEDRSPAATPRTNILSHMAKHKTSWVENTLQNRAVTAQRSSPILVKGKNPNTFETPYEKSQKAKDFSTKGVRDGKRFDLLPISKYLQSKREGFGSSQERLPLVRISSVQRVPIFNTQSRYYSNMKKSRRLPTTFFAQKDMFKPRESRSQPTRGESAFVEIREQLPSLYKKQYNAPVVKMGRDQKSFGMRDTATLTLPTVF